MVHAGMVASSSGVRGVVGINIVTSLFCIKKLHGALSLGSCDVASIDAVALAVKQHRQQEYLDCLKINMCSPAVNKIVLLVEGLDALQLLQSEVLDAAAFSSSTKAKIVPMMVPRQPNYSQFFDTANRLFGRHNAHLAPGGTVSGSGAELQQPAANLCMVCNADIHVPSIRLADRFPVASIYDLFGAYRVAQERRQQALLPDGDTGDASTLCGHERMVLALTRYESEMAGVDGALPAPLIEEYRGSHDAFVFEAPLPRPFVNNVRHPQNCYKAENVVIHELRASGKALVLNPSLDVKLMHRHAADVRQWMPAVDETRYGRSEPTSLSDAMRLVQGVAA